MYVKFHKDRFQTVSVGRDGMSGQTNTSKKIYGYLVLTTDPKNNRHANNDANLYTSHTLLSRALNRKNHEGMVNRFTTLRSIPSQEKYFPSLYNLCQRDSYMFLPDRFSNHNL